MISSSTTNTQDREEWRARIRRALAELETMPPGFDGGGRMASTKHDESSGAQSTT